MKNNLIARILESISHTEERQIEAKMLISKKIINALRDKNISKKKFMELIGKKHQSEITKWLSGTHNFTTDTIIEIEDALDIKILNIEIEEYQMIDYRSINTSIPYIPFNHPSKSMIWTNNIFEQKIILHGDC